MVDEVRKRTSECIGPCLVSVRPRPLLLVGGHRHDEDHATERTLDALVLEVVPSFYQRAWVIIDHAGVLWTDTFILVFVALILVASLLYHYPLVRVIPDVVVAAGRAVFVIQKVVVIL